MGLINVTMLLENNYELWKKMCMDSNLNERKLGNVKELGEFRYE